MNALSCMRIRNLVGLSLLWALLAVAGLSCTGTELGPVPGPLPKYEAVDIQPAWSPTSDWIAFVHSGDETDHFETILLIRPDGSESEKIVNWGHEPDWSPQGDRIMYLDGWDGLSTKVYDLASDSTWILFPRGRVFSVDWSPDGSKVAGVRSADGTPDICVSDLETLQCRWFGPGDEPDWSPDGSELLCLWDGICIMDSSGAGRRQVVSYRSGDPQFLDAHWHPDGGRIVFSQFDWDLWDWRTWLVNADGTGLRCLGSGTDPAWSPSGEQIVFADDVPEGSWKSVRLWIMNADGTGRRQLTFPDTTQVVRSQ
ncbi:MAG: PD40 domain-containing protein [Candidatus Eisenbacteria sp.]|nr:PD40 domain-containing protein [Candidatus Eisenbacteria bacterium]